MKGRVQDRWPLTVEAYRLDSARTRLGGLTVSMFRDPSRPRQVLPLLKATARRLSGCAGFCHCRGHSFSCGQPMAQATVLGVGFALGDLLNFPSTRRERKGTDHYTEHALPLVGQRPQAPGDGKLC